MRILLTLPLLALLTLACTTTVEPSPALLAKAAAGSSSFSHAALDRVLRKYVDEWGQVDYAGLSASRDDLDLYYAQIAQVSPESHPALFPDEQAELAYWINAYNGAVLQTVIAYYPIESVRDVRPPAALFFLPRLAGFFYLQRVVVGGRETNLYDLEHSVVIDRYQDPRVHFALNCASLGCPRLPQRAFRPDDLERELEAAAREFVGEIRNVRIDAAAGTMVLSSIFDWYESEFEAWQKARRPDDEASLLGFIRPYLTPDQRSELDACEACDVEFETYDWGLNDQGAER